MSIIKNLFGGGQADTSAIERANAEARAAAEKEKKKLETQEDARTAQRAGRRGAGRRALLNLATGEAGVKTTLGTGSR